MSKKLDENSDKELYESLYEGGKIAEQAFGVLYARHSSRVYAYCRRFLGNREEAEDVFQETFIRFHQSASKDRDMTNVPGFLLKIARNLCVSLKRNVVHSVTIEDYMVVNSEDVDKSELLDLIKYAMELLPDGYKEVFVLREYNGLSYKEIADMTGDNMNSVKVKIHRAKQKIREILSPVMAEMTKYE